MLPGASGRSATLPKSDSKTRVGEAHPGPKLTLASVALIVPAVIFYSVLFRTTLNLPILDDYNAILDFLNRWIGCRTGREKLVLFFSSQLVDVKTFLVHTAALLQYATIGHVNFRFLTGCYVALMPLLVLLLWKMFIPSYSNRTDRLVLFLPIPFLLFQLQYMTELDVVTEGMAHIGALFFSLLTIYWLHRDTRSRVVGAVIALIFAVASDAYAFLLIPIGLLTLVRQRRFGWLAVYLTVSIACVASYAFHYNNHASPVDATQDRQSLPLAIAMRILYVLGFLGSAAGFNSHFLAGALILGFALVAFYIWKALKGEARRSRLLYDCALFLFLTAALAASGRSGLGLSQSLSGRYTLYSLVFVSLFWMLLAKDLVARRSNPLGSGPVLTMFICSVAFSLFWDLIGYSAIMQRNESLTAAILKFEHPSPANPDPFPVPNYRFPGPNGVAEGTRLCQDMRSIMRESVENGVYRPEF